VRHFYGRLAKQALPLLWEAFKRGDAIAALLAFLFGIAGLTWVLQLIPWWIPVGALGLLFLYGLLRANYEEFQKVEGAKQDLESKLASTEKRKAVKDLLGVAVEQGEDLRVILREEGGQWNLVSQQDVEDWVHRTHDLIEAAFDKGEARRFLDSSDYKPEKPLPYREVRADPYKYHLTPRLQRLNELIVRANSLEVNPEFDPPSEIQPTEETTAARLRLEAAVEQTKAMNEELEATNERLTRERDTLELESRLFKGERDGQIRGRCIELTDELHDFLTLNRALDPEEVMRLYEGQLRDKVNRLRSDLMRLGWWRPREDVKQKLEFPETPDHLWSIYSYIRNIGVGAE
jgi:hypothetical protein